MPPNKILITAGISFLYYPILSKHILDAGKVRGSGTHQIFQRRLFLCTFFERKKVQAPSRLERHEKRIKKKIY
ncbi:hypothetical protein C5745_18500 [Sphingobacterium haloxyli]|uniref:Uncharacterized protein n=1 Tax=Sphingobacterium haloxyli TaxID=2100533 RepID=A0A2S9IWV6_9SPHI|nr:hypothetical protein C5745_18500 [Sphingobacterium haloxyli]